MSGRMAWAATVAACSLIAFLLHVPQRTAGPRGLGLGTQYSNEGEPGHPADARSTLRAAQSRQIGLSSLSPIQASQFCDVDSPRLRFRPHPCKCDGSGGSVKLHSESTRTQVASAGARARISRSHEQTRSLSGLQQVEHIGHSHFGLRATA
eukprot:scaffold17819_cov120-Isochrysis_galbana.AAC.5